MKILLINFLVLMLCVQVFGQVGINTTEPSATLDVNGTIRVRDFISNNEVLAEKILGLDENGNFVSVTVGENIILQDNELRVVENRYHSSWTTTIIDGYVDNFDLLILPGEPNDDKKIMKIETSLRSVSFTGLKAGEDGQMIWLMALSDKIKLLPLNSASVPENQFLIDNVTTFFRYQMVQLVYDGTLQKWMIMGN